ncbi:hypothetical protein [Telmatospirillum sp. J64-1]|uniref:hypothetical protein n=1 Tax=Telmatospirillum sp. J64-1 TaxID=2502183 RepID=UPI00115D8289|nr:hypothetical protein [Telmatospirillum sp. J64-1]
MSKIRQGWIGIHLHLSQLRPYNRQDAHLRIALRMFDPLVNGHRSQLFLLTNSDIVLLCRDVPLRDLDELVYKLRALFAKDPLTFSDSGDGRDRFCTWYELAEDYEAFFAMAREMDEEARRRMRQQQPEGASLPPLEPKRLGELLHQLGTIDVSPFVRRQAAIDIATGSHAGVIFQEFFFSVADLQRAVAPDTGLLGNRWLFQHMSETLDRRMLGVLSDLKLKSLPPAASVNLNVGTTINPSFKEFVAAIEKRVKLIVEVQLIDVFSDLGAFFFARDWLQERGHRVLLDGLNPLSLQFSDITQYGADLVKLNWSPDYTEGGTGEEVQEGLLRFGLDKAILARCDSESAIRWGMETGITKFQGRYVDAMLAAYTMAGCPQGKPLGCTLGQCISRRGVLSGAPRAECGDLTRLDAFPRMQAPRR